ncbi:AarF/UbiB family protein [Endozoicomonas sp. ONNA2]|uniref:AarF/UbiB family protein n=1 Tax=Endozoicomonas sp. ONNA2 TaxID=2828741 RepID=UPI0021480F1F
MERHIATGTIGSCFEVKKDEESYLVKVVPDWKAIDLVAGLKSIRMLMLFLPKTMKTAFRELTDPFIAECQLNEEKKNQTVFKEALEKTDKEVPLELPLLNEKKLTFKVPEITETSDADNLLIMEYLHDAHTLNALANPANKQLRSEIFHRYYSDFPFRYDDFYGMALLGTVHGLVKTKWHELALKHGIVHGDCHPGNIMLRFKPGGHIDVWFIDFGNCIMLTEAQMALYPENVGLLSKLANPYLPEAVNQARVDRLVDIIWDEMAISIEDNTPANKETFKNKMLNSFIALRNYETTINESSMSPKDKAILINGFNDPSKKELIRVLFFSFASTTMSSICKEEGIELPSSFTRYNAAHFRAGIDLA